MKRYFVERVDLRCDALVEMVKVGLECQQGERTDINGVTVHQL